MPRAHTKAEQERIRRALINRGRNRFVRQGLAKTTVAELARDAGIGKGSFYRFFDSKEALFFAVQEAEEQGFEADLQEELVGATSGPEAVRALLLAVSQRLERHPFLKALLDPEVVAALMVRVPKAQLAAHREQDRAGYQELVRQWQGRGWLRRDISAETIFAVVTATYALSLERHIMGEEDYRRATDEIAEAMAARWCV